MLFQHGELALPEGIKRLDLRTEGERIVEIGTLTPLPGEKVVDISGKLLLPGLIDTHTHLDMGTPLSHTADNFATGSRAAIAGGTTVILDFATQERGETLEIGLSNWHELPKKGAYCDYGFHMAISDWNGHTKAEMAQVVAQGVTSFKLYMAYAHLRVSDEQALEILQQARALGALTGMHCEVGDWVDEGVAAQKAQGNLSPAAHPLSRPDTVEAEAIRRWIDIAERADCPIYVVHLSTKKGLEEVRRGRARGVKVLAETCPQYLILDDAKYDQPDFEGAKFVLSPPLRKQEDIDALWQAIENGEIDFVGTDHCAYHFETDKKRGIDDFSKIPNGIPGVEHRPALMYTYGVKAGRMSEDAFVKLLASNAARIFGMPQKGSLEVGKDADLVVWNRDTQWTITAENQHQAVDYTPYEGMAVTGFPEQVYLRGSLEHHGQFLKRSLPDLSQSTVAHLL